MTLMLEGSKTLIPFKMIGGYFSLDILKAHQRFCLESL